MTMSDNEQLRFAALKSEYISLREAEEILWVKPDHPYLEPMLRSFGELIQSARAVIRNDGLVSRYLLEQCLHHFSLVPLPLAAVRLGMTIDSFNQTFQAMVDMAKILPSELGVNSPTVSRKLVDDIHKQLSSLRNRVFHDHNDYCRRLHAAIEAELGVRVIAAWCTTSQHLSPPEKDYAYTLCMISGEPTALHNQVLLIFKKPLRLPPDVCSRAVYARNQAALMPFVFSRPSIAGLPVQ